MSSWFVLLSLATLALTQDSYRCQFNLTSSNLQNNCGFVSRASRNAGGSALTRLCLSVARISRPNGVIRKRYHSVCADATHRSGRVAASQAQSIDDCVDSGRNFDVWRQCHARHRHWASSFVSCQLRQRETETLDKRKKKKNVCGVLTPARSGCRRIGWHQAGRLELS
jgi:hypothetical protein